MKSTIYTAIMILAAATLASCMQEPLPLTGTQGRISASASFGAATKGAPLTAVPATFTLYAAAYSGSVPGATNYIYGETMTKTDGRWVSANAYGAVPGDRTVLYWAVGGSAGATLPTASATGWPKIAYESPAAASAQEDIIVASSSGAGSRSSLTLPFSHILCAVEAKVATSGAFDGTVTAIKLRNVYGAGDYTLGSGWANVTAKTDLTSTIDVALTEDDGGKALLSGASTLMVIPQTLPSDAAVEVTATVDGDSVSVSAPLTGVSVAAGRKAVLSLDLSELGRKILTVESVTLTDWVADSKSAVMKKSLPLLEGVFTVGPGKKVKFTSGNLYWDGSEYAVEALQYDYPTTWNTSHVGHFLWSPSKDVAISTTTSVSGSTTDTFFAANGGAIEGYTVLSQTEWNYIFGHALAKNSSGENTITIDGKNCIVLKPDGFAGTVADSYTAEQWAAAESQYGLVALPFAGRRQGTSLSKVGSGGRYWSGTPNASSASNAYNAYFGSSEADTGNYGRYYGYSVRLVKVYQFEPIFTVNTSGKKVEFAPGNLYWDGSEFHFEEHQYDYQTSWNTSHVGLFYWSKSAPVACASSYSDSGASISDKFFAADGGAIEGWTVLDKDEWNYLLSHALSSCNNPSGDYTTIDGKKCIVLMPDGFTGTVNDSYTAVEWAVAESAYGLVALPLAGCRNNTSFDDVGSYGDYWASSPHSSNSTRAHDVCLYVNSATSTDGARKYGCSVRLVKVRV